MFRRILPVIYVLVGVIVAAQHDYLAHLSTLSRIVSAALAIALWPLVLLGISLVIR